MTFTVNPDALGRYGDLLTRAADDARAGKDYLDKYGHPNDAGGEPYGWFMEVHKDSVTAVEGALGQIACTAESGRAGLAVSAHYYQTTDHGTAVAFDNTLRLVPCQARSELDAKVDALVCPPIPFNDWRHARDRLEEPEAPDQPGGLASNPLASLEAMSVSGVVLYALHEVFGFDPIEYLVGKVEGDWEKLYECGVALGNVAELCEDIAVNIDQGARELDRVWDGNAGDAAAHYFQRFAASIDGMPAPLRTMHDTHQQAAQGAWQTAEAIKTALSALIDDAVVVALMFAAGDALVETGVGTLICYGAAVGTIAEMYETYQAAMKAIHTFYSLIMGLVGFVHQAVAAINGLPQLPAIADAYQPAVPG